MEHKFFLKSDNNKHFISISINYFTNNLLLILVTCIYKYFKYLVL